MSLKFGHKIEIHAPGTVANLVCGFDILGFCLHEPCDVMELTLTDSGTVVIEPDPVYNLPTKPEDNVAGMPLLAIIDDYKEQKIGFHLKITKNIKPGSGIGSSAASAAGAVVGANHLLNNLFTKEELVQYAMLGEKVATGVKHADNIAPCIYGGITLIRSIAPLDIIPLESPELYVTIVHPQIEVKTSDARAILKKQIELKTAIKQWGNIAGLVAGILQKDYQLIGRSLEDHIIEPIRSILIPKFDEVKAKSKNLGALGGGISGSGPSIFMLSDNLETAKKIELAMQEIYDEINLSRHTYVTTINNVGVRIVSSE